MKKIVTVVDFSKFLFKLSTLGNLFKFSQKTNMNFLLKKTICSITKYEILIDLMVNRFNYKLVPCIVRGWQHYSYIKLTVISHSGIPYSYLLL